MVMVYIRLIGMYFCVACMINAYDMHFKVYTVPQTLHDFSEQANMYLIDRIFFMITAIYNMIDPALCCSVTRV